MLLLPAELLSQVLQPDRHPLPQGTEQGANGLWDRGSRTFTELGWYFLHDVQLSQGHSGLEVAAAGPSPLMASQ